jgi:hypothetical protein
MMPGHEGQHAALALDSQTVRARDHFNRVDSPARQAIDGVEHLEGANQIELIDGRHDDDDDPSARGVAAHTGLRRGGCHASAHYAEPLMGFASGTRTNGGFRRISVANRRVVLRYDARVRVDRIG